MCVFYRKLSLGTGLYVVIILRMGVLVQPRWSWTLGETVLKYVSKI